MNRIAITLSTLGLGFALSAAQATDGGAGKKSSVVYSKESSHRTQTVYKPAPTKGDEHYKSVKSTTPVIHKKDEKVTKSTFLTKVGKDGFKDDLILKHNTKTKYFPKKDVDLKYPEKYGKLVKIESGGKARKFYCYPGKHHHHWKYRCWNRHYCCWFYWDPCCECYYYWYPERCCWAPVTCSPYDVPDYSGDATVPSDDGDDMAPPPDDDDDGEQV